MNTFIHYHTLDLRIHDSPSIYQAHQPNNTSTHFLPIYIFDARQLDLSYLPNTSSSPPNQAGESQAHQDESTSYQPKRTRCSPKSRLSGFHRTSPFRLKFLLESVFELRESYRRSGGDMVIAYGHPEKILPKLVDHLQGGEGKVEGIWAQREYSLEEISNYRRIQQSLDKASDGIEIRFNDSKTLIPKDHLPFKAELETPDVYTEFRKQVEGLGIGLNELLLKPLHTSQFTEDERIKVKVDHGEFKPFPSDLNLDEIKLDQGSGGFLKDDNQEINTIEGLYGKLVKPILDNPPIGGWSSASTSTSRDIPNYHPRSAIPFAGSEKAALERLEDYLGSGKGDKWQGGNKAKHYKETRNGLLGEGFSTKFSSWLSLGAISPKEIGWRVGEMLEVLGRDKEVYKNVYWILFELLWRDYFQYTVLKTSLVNNSRSRKNGNDETTPNSSLFNPDGFSKQISTYPKDLRPDPSDWNVSDLSNPDDPARRWCEGKTGVPFIDANMRELVETGWMSNRGRQNVASFLTKDLYCDWRIGAEFFEMHLVDYDTCSNWGNWQYQAGVGNDPRSSRQFNPIKQANDYDENNEYVKTWINELEGVDNDYAQTPWLASDKSNLKEYPNKPIVELPSWKKHYPNQPSTRNRYGKGGKAKAKGNGKGPKGGKKEEQ